jgi:hypothetical protein
LRIPSGTLDLETEDKSTFFGFGEIFFPIELLGDISENHHLVELDTLLGLNLLDGSQEGLRVEESVEESNLGEFGRLIFPSVELIKSLLDVVQPGVETSGRWESKFLPKSRDLVHEDGVHQDFHLTGKCQLTLECQGNVGKVANDLLNEDVHVTALLQE